MSNPEIEISRLTKSFETGGKNHLTVFDGLSLTLERGGFYSILGPSGCGKTTLLRIIAGVEKTDSGEVYVRPDSTLSLVYQQNDLLPWLTVEENIRLAIKSRGGGARALSGMTREYLDKVGLGDFHGFYPSQISGGMQKRASLARALAADAQVILCDEPLAFLDYQNRTILRKLITDLFVEQKKTIVYVTHDIHEALELSRKAIVLSALPAKVKAVVDIPFGYPRDIDDLKLSREYHQLVTGMKEALREEIAKAHEREQSFILDSGMHPEGKAGR